MRMWIEPASIVLSSTICRSQTQIKRFHYTIVRALIHCLVCVCVCVCVFQYVTFNPVEPELSKTKRCSWHHWIDRSNLFRITKANRAKQLLFQRLPLPRQRNSGTQRANVEIYRHSQEIRAVDDAILKGSKRVSLFYTRSNLTSVDSRL